jgi:hypothetical protein
VDVQPDCEEANFEASSGPRIGLGYWLVVGDEILQSYCVASRCFYVFAIAVAQG